MNVAQQWLRRQSLHCAQLTCLGALTFGVSAPLFAQAGVSFVEVPQIGPVDPVRDLVNLPTVGYFHQPLPEEYLWTAGDAAVLEHLPNLSRVKQNDWKVEPHGFRRSFDLKELPKTATLYVAGPRRSRIWINGELAASFTYEEHGHMSFLAQAADVTRFLRSGQNTIAIEAVRGYGSSHHTNSVMTKWVNSGEVLAVKILPAAEGINASPLLISDSAWQSSATLAPGWQLPAFDASAWKLVVHHGIESDADFYQWQADAGMYAWPGYIGEAPYMANYRMEPLKTTETPEGLVVDFGRELNGRIVLTAGATALNAQVRYAESLGELHKGGFLGDAPFRVAAGTEERGPKSGFRYALVRFDGAQDGAKISVEGIVYPAPMLGRFQTNDPRMNRIWETAAYTSHLCMQDSILDGIKRDRGLWIGDSEAIHRVVADVYGDARLVKQGLADSIGDAPVHEHVNGLPSYSAWWVVAESEYVMRWGDMEQLKQMTPKLIGLLGVMQKELDEHSLYNAAAGGKPFVDWAPDFKADSPEARRATHFEYLLAFRRAAWMLKLAGQEEESKKISTRADAMAKAAQELLRERDLSYGDRWQTNAIAVLAGSVNTEEERAAVWKVLSRTVTGAKPSDHITPYYGLYLLMAMAQLGHREEALRWVNSYWGGMLDQGATSFFEAWDPSYAGNDPHAKMEADDKVGYYTSLAHGWAGGPAAWMLEELAGIKAIKPGFQLTRIRPELAGLTEFKSAMPTPLGLVRVEAQEGKIAVEIPQGMRAILLLPKGQWLQGNVVVQGLPAELGNRTQLELNHAGHYEFVRN